ncbi:hypothetical protein GXW82_04420 [Streptacidiphilus sp. 4-A2]|nr:hypothetical protein [Streptacidiphilus sp. 4-A2]
MDSATARPQEPAAEDPGTDCPTPDLSECQEAVEEYEFPLCHAQARLLVLDQMNPGTAQYTVPVAFRVHGRFDADAFRRALDAVVARHESLRTVFRTGVDGDAVQIVSARAAAALRVEREVPAAEVHRRMLAEAARPFAVDSGPLLRCTVHHADDGTHGVLLAAHHLICDGWSLDVLLRDLSAGYRAELGRLPWEPGELPLQYPDFAAWQRERQDAGGYADSVGYWVRSLRGAPAVLPLPLDRPRPALRTTAGGTESFSVPAAVKRRITALAGARGGTPFMVLLAVWAAFLGRLSDVEDLVIGYPVSGRDRAETQDLIGMLTNTLALRVDLSGDPSLEGLVDRVRAALLAAAPYQDAPFEAVVEQLAPVRETSHDPVLQVVIGYDDDTEPELRLPGARTERVPLNLDVAKFDLHLHLDRHGEDLDARLIYRSDLFEAATVRRWVNNFQLLLDRALSAPGLPLSRIDLVPRTNAAGCWPQRPHRPGGA